MSDVEEVTDRFDSDLVIAEHEEEENGEEGVDDDDEEEEESEEEDVMGNLPPIMKARVEFLRAMHRKKEELMQEYLLERAALEQKYATMLEPMFDRRRDVLIGLKEAPVEYVESVPNEENIIGIPQFWVAAMGHIECVGELVTEDDVECLEFLRDIRCEDSSDGKGFTLKFFFAPNDYFTNEVLSKKYMIPNLLLDDEPVLQQVTGTKIEWKEGNSLCFKNVKKKQRSKKGPNAGKVRTVTRQERLESFFHFFTPPKLPNMEDMDEEDVDALEEAFDHDYDVAQAFRSHIIPNAVAWFTGEALDNEFEIPDEEDNVESNSPSPFPSPVKDTEGESPEECKQT